MAKEIVTKECEDECPKCGSYKYNVIDSTWDDDTEIIYCECNDCSLQFNQTYIRAYCNSGFEQDVDLNTKTLWDKY